MQSRAVPAQLIVLFLIAAAASLRLVQLGQDSFWLDEAYSHWFSAQTWHTIWVDVTSYDFHPPLYFSLLKLWRVFGETEFALRALSVIAATATVPFIYLIGRQTLPGRDGVLAGVIAAALFVVSPLHLDYAQQARPYTLLTLSVAVSLSGAAWLAVRPALMARPWLDIKGFAASLRLGPAAGETALPAWCALIVGAAGAMWFHNTAIVFVVSLGLTGLWIAARQGMARAHILNFVIAGCAILALWSPFAATFFGQLGGVTRDHWTPELSWRRALGPLSTLLDIKSIQPITVAPILGILGYIGLKAMEREGRQNTAILLAGLFFIAYALLVLFSVAVQSVFIERVFVWMSLPCLVAFAAGIASVRKPAMKAGVAAAILVVSMYGSWQLIKAPSHEPWRQVAEFISAEAGPGEAVMTIPNSLTIPLSYYLKPLRPDIDLVGLPEPFPARRQAVGEAKGIDFNPRIAPDDTAVIGGHADAASRVWVIDRLAAHFDPDAVVLDTLRRHRTETLSIPLANHMMLYRFE